MRIITGSARGCNLLTLPGDNTRPTSERAKEAVFSVLQFSIEGRRVLDLFSGSGQMALEALSRGAQSAVTVDSSADAIGIIRKNAEKTHLSDRCRIVRAELPGYIRKMHDGPFDIVFMDPPYRLGLIPQCLSFLYEEKALKPTSVVVCESASFDDVFAGMEAPEKKYSVIKCAKYGLNHITFLKPVTEEEQ